jgi:hypothetical protein
VVAALAGESRAVDYPTAKQLRVTNIVELQNAV